MREAFGGTFMIELLLIFLAIYIAFIAVALNYAKAFRVKNHIIDMIEQKEGIDSYSDNNGIIGEINTYLSQFGYFVTIPNKSEDNIHCYSNGYCIEEFAGTSSIEGISAKYYKVTTYMRVEFPFFDLNISIPIQGETRMIQIVGG